MPRDRAFTSHRGYWLQSLAVVAAYVVAAKVDALLPLAQDGLMLFWPPAGIALAALLLGGLRLLPAVGVGAFLAPLISGAPWAAVLMQGLGGTASALLGLGLLTWRRVDKSLDAPRDVLELALWGGLAACMVAASLGSLALLAGGLVTWDSLKLAWLTWWVGNSAAVVLITPLILTWASRRPIAWRPSRRTEGMLWLVLFLGIGILVFSGWLSPSTSDALDFLPFPLLFWAALRFGRRLTSLASFVLCCGAVASAAQGVGPLAEMPLQEGMLLLWAYLGILAAGALSLAAAVSQAGNALKRLAENRDGLAQAVDRRTSQLVEANQELRRTSGRLRAILDSTSDGFLDLDENLVLTDLNPAAERMLHCQAAEVIGKPFFASFPDVDGGFFEEKFRRALREKTPLSFERYFKREPFRNWYQVRVYPQQEGISVFFQVTTEQKEAAQALAASEERYRTLVEENPLGVALIDSDGRYLYLNRSFSDIFGYTLADLPTGKDWFQQAFPDQTLRNRVLEAWQKDKAAAPPGKVRPRTFSTRCKDGSYKEVLYRPVSLSGGEQLVSYEDVSQREQAARALAESEEKFSKAFRHSPVWVVLNSVKTGRYLEVNQAFLEATGWKREEVIGRTAEDIELRIDPTERKSIIRTIREKGAVRNREVKRRTKDGRLLTMLYSGDIVEIGGEECLISQVQDITERKEAEEALRASEERFSKLYMASPAWISLTQGEDGRYLEVNRAFERITGYSRAEVVGRTPMELGLWPKQGPWRRMVDGLKREGSLRQVPVTLCMRLGEKRHFMWSAELLKLGSRTSQLNVLQDVTELRRAQEALQEREEQYRLLVSTALDAIYILQDGKLVFANPEVERITGLSAAELAETHFSELIHPDDLELTQRRYEQRLAGETVPDQYPLRVLRPDGRVLWIQASAAELTWKGRPAIMYVARDITDQRRMENQLRQSQKLEAVGTLAGGIAHDFNNILAAIMGYAELSLEAVPPQGEVAQNLSQVIAACKRARDLIRQILSFSRHSKHSLRPTALEPLVREVLGLIRATSPSNVAIRTKLEKGGWTLADPVQIHQLLMNLCANAVQAMESTGGSLEVSLKRVKLAAGDEALNSSLQPGPYLRLSVADTGPGIDPALRERVFEPFFTTKETGRGSGLGLSAAHGIVQAHQGSMRLDEAPGGGALFQVYLPELEQDQDYSPGREPPSQPAGHERVMFVDDEPALADIGQHILSRLGYQVRVYTSSREALAQFKKTPEAFDLIISDQTMPGLTGSALAQEVKAVRPQVPVIICTGFSHQLSPEQAEEIGVAAFVMKPITSHEIARVIRQVLDEPGQAPPEED